MNCPAGTRQATVDLRAKAARRSQRTVRSRRDLSRGNHTVKIVDTSTSVGMSDAFRITA